MLLLLCCYCCLTPAKLLDTVFPCPLSLYNSSKQTCTKPAGPTSEGRRGSYLVPCSCCVHMRVCMLMLLVTTVLREDPWFTGSHTNWFQLLGAQGSLHCSFMRSVRSVFRCACLSHVQRWCIICFTVCHQFSWASTDYNKIKNKTSNGSRQNTAMLKVRTKAHNIKFILTHLFRGATAREPK